MILALVCATALPSALIWWAAFALTRPAPARTAAVAAARLRTAVTLAPHRHRRP